MLGLIANRLPDTVLIQISDQVFEGLGQGDAKVKPMLLACRAVRDVVLQMIKEEVNRGTQ